MNSQRMRHSVMLLAILLVTASIGPALAAAAGPLSVPFLKQVMMVNGEQNWNQNCGQTSCVMVEAYYKGIAPSNSRIIEVNSNVTGYKDGNPQLGVATSIYDWAEILNWMGIESKVYNGNGTMEQIKAHLNSGQPIIGFFYGRYSSSYSDNVKPSNGHAMVIVGYSDAARTIIVSDPGSGGNYYRSFSYDTFLNKLWTKHDMVAALSLSANKPVTPTPKPTPMQTVSYTFDRYGPGIISEPGSRTVTVGQPIGELPVIKPENTNGWQFEGWFTAKDGGAIITPDNLVTATSDFSIYSRWSTIVTFDSNGGSPVQPGTMKMVYNQAYGSLPVTSLAGFNFKGWFTQPSDGTQITAENKIGVIPNQRLYAQWVPVMSVNVKELTLSGVETDKTEYTVNEQAQWHIYSKGGTGDHQYQLELNRGEELYFSSDLVPGTINVMAFPTTSFSATIPCALSLPGIYTPTVTVRDSRGETAAFTGEPVTVPEPIADPTATPSPALPGDATIDGIVDILDLVSIIDYIVSNTSPASPANADANGDGTVDILDLVWIIDQIVGE